MKVFKTAHIQNNTETNKISEISFSLIGNIFLNMETNIKNSLPWKQNE